MNALAPIDPPWRTPRRVDVELLIPTNGGDEEPETAAVNVTVSIDREGFHEVTRSDRPLTSDEETEAFMRVGEVDLG